MKDVFSQFHTADRPVPFGFLLLVLLISDCFLATAIIKGNFSPQARLWFVLAGVFAFVVIITLVTIALWRVTRPSLFGQKLRLAKRREVIIDISPEEVDKIWESFLSEGAYVATLRQPDGRYTLEALFMGTKQS